MKVWASAKSVRSEVADVPENWLRMFAVTHPDAVRKFGSSRNATLLFNTHLVLKAIKEKEGTR